MAISKVFNGNIEVTKLLKSMGVDQSIIIEIAEGFTVQEAFNTVTGSSSVRLKGKRGKEGVPFLQISVAMEAMTAISGNCNDKLSKLLRITKTAECYI